MTARVVFALCLAACSASQSPAPSTATGCASYDAKRCAVEATCHPVFRLAGDAALFDHCSNAATVNCTKPSMACDEPDPSCGSDAYRVAWPGGCHDGCVEAKRCTP